MRLVKLTQEDGTALWVNPEKVCYVHGPPAISRREEETEIGFALGFAMTVAIEVEAVVKALTSRK